MIKVGNAQPNKGENNWQVQLDQFIKANQFQLAALTWGLFQDQTENREVLGIDLKPTPHFVSCSRESLETLNRNVGNQLQELLGVVDGYQPSQEVVLLAIGNGQIKLINFQSDPPPPDCFAQVAEDTQSLLNLLEQRLTEQLEPHDSP